MPKRFIDSALWDEDWFIDLASDHKLFYIYLWSNCDNGGIWRVNRSRYRQITHSMPMLDDFIRAINKDHDDSGAIIEVVRILPLQNKRWFITNFITEQCGKIFKPDIGAHRGFLKVLINNDIHPSKIADFDWCGFELLDIQELKKMVYSKSMYRLCMEYAYSVVSLKEKEQEKEKEIGKGGSAEGGEIPDNFQKIYESSLADYIKDLPGGNNLTEKGFNLWKKYVDDIRLNNLYDIFISKFIYPLDFQTVYKNGFKESYWLPVTKKMLSSGVTKSQNLTFRIPQFIEYYEEDIRKLNYRKKAVTSNMDTGNNEEEDFKIEDRW